MSDKKICPFFLRGICRYGAGCKDLHEYPNSNPGNSINPIPKNPNQNTKSTNCKYFFTNTCNKGSNCPFFHGYADRLQHIKTIDNHQNQINNLVNMDDTKYISSDNQVFYVRFSGNDDLHGENISSEYQIGKLIYSSNKVICSIQKNGM